MCLKYLSPNQRLVVKKGYGCKLLGPGTVFGILLQEICLIDDLLRSDLMIIRNVRTTQELTVNFDVQVTYQIDFKLLTPEIVDQIPKLKNEKKWDEMLKLRLECIIRRRCASYTWSQLCDPAQQIQLQNDARNYLDRHMVKVGIRVTECLIHNVSLPPKVQEALEQNSLAARRREMILQVYEHFFGGQLPDVLPDLVRMELVNALLEQNGRATFRVDQWTP